MDKEQYKAHVAVLREALDQIDGAFAYIALNPKDNTNLIKSTSEHALRKVRKALSSTPSDSYEELKKLREELEFQRNAHNQAQELLKEQGSQVAKLIAERDSMKEDAGRWGTMSGLMFLGNVFAEQDEDGGYKITLDPAENLLGVSWEGNSPEDAYSATT